MLPWMIRTAIVMLYTSVKPLLKQKLLIDHTYVLYKSCTEVLDIIAMK